MAMRTLWVAVAVGFALASLADAEPKDRRQTGGGGLACAGALADFTATWPAAAAASARADAVVCNGVDVVGLRLSGSGLIGSVPRTVAWPRTLAVLDLSGNELQGTIDPGICTLPSLTALLLGNNSFTGSIPVCVNELHQLEHLGLGGNQLTGDIPWQAGICALSPTLKTLGLGHNQLTGPVSSCLGAFSKLTGLFLGVNKLTGPIPWGTAAASAGGSAAGAGICALALRDLHLYHNAFSAGPVPPCVCDSQKTTLVNLKLENTQLTGSANTLLSCRFAKLANLSLGYNQLTGQMTESLCTMRSLTALYLGGNGGIDGAIPGCIYRLVALRELNLIGLALSGLPAGLFALPKLRTLVVSGADFGDFPAELSSSCFNCQAAGGGCPVVSFAGDDDYFGDDDDGYVPTTANPANGAVTTGAPTDACDADEMRWLPKITVFAMPGCGLRGSIPAWLASSPTLKELVLSGNALTGPLLPLTAPKLRHFAVAHNHITGTLAPLEPAVGRLLTRVDVSYNSISGSVPAIFAARSRSMASLIATHNHLSCNLPVDPPVTIAAGGKLDILTGNTFASPIPTATVEANIDGTGYFAESLLMDYGIIAVLIVLVLAVLFKFATGCSSPQAVVPMREDTRLQTALSAALNRVIFQVFLGGAVLMVVYETSDSFVLECVTGWRSSAAYRSDWSGDGGRWAYGLVFVGGLLFGLSLVRFTYTGLRDRLITAPGTTAGLQPGLSPSNAAADGLTKKMMASVMMLLAFCASLAINIAYVVVETSTFFTTPFKAGWIVIFAVVHELLDHLVYPLVVLAMCRTMKSVTHLAQNPHRTDIHVTRVLKQHATSVWYYVVLLELGNSVLAPLLGFLFMNEGCTDGVFDLSATTHTVPVDREYCDILNAAAGFGCNQTATMTVDISYAEPFVFDGEACVTSVVALYAPAYLAIFALRILLLAPAWVLAHVYKTPWLLVGTTPPPLLKSVFLLGRPGTTGLARRLNPEAAGQHGGRPGQHPADAGGDDGNGDVGGGDTHDAVLSVPKLSSTAQANPTLQILHSIEADAFALNCITIAVSLGMLVPFIALAAGFVLLARRMLFRTLAALRRQHAESSDDDASGEQLMAQLLPGGSSLELDDMSGTRATAGGSDHAVFYPLPWGVVATMLLFHSVTNDLFLVSIELYWGAYLVTGLNWLLMLSVTVAACKGQQNEPRNGHYEADVEL